MGQDKKRIEEIFSTEECATALKLEKLYENTHNALADIESGFIPPGIVSIVTHCLQKQVKLFELELNYPTPKKKNPNLKINALGPRQDISEAMEIHLKVKLAEVKKLLFNLKTHSGSC